MLEENYISFSIYMNFNPYVTKYTFHPTQSSTSKNTQSTLKHSNNKETQKDCTSNLR